MTELRLRGRLLQSVPRARQMLEDSSLSSIDEVIGGASGLLGEAGLGGGPLVALSFPGTLARVLGSSSR